MGLYLSVYETGKSCQRTDNRVRSSVALRSGSTVCRRIGKFLGQFVGCYPKGQCGEGHFPIHALMSRDSPTSTVRTDAALLHPASVVALTSNSSQRCESSNGGNR